jgi:hypothetical protein
MEGDSAHSPYSAASGEHARESIMTPTQEKVYFAACPSPLGDVALLLLDTGLRLGEASRAATCANANAAQNACGLRIAFVTAHLRNAARRVRGGCVHYNATNGAFDRNSFSAVRSSVTGSARTGI